MKNKNEQMITREQYDIFTIVTDKNTENNDNVLLTIGNYCLAKFENVEECKKYVNSKPYELIVSLTTIITEKTIEVLKLKTKNNEN